MNIMTFIVKRLMIFQFLSQKKHSLYSISYVSCSRLHFTCFFILVVSVHLMHGNWLKRSRYHICKKNSIYFVFLFTVSLFWFELKVTNWNHVWNFLFLWTLLFQRSLLLNDFNAWVRLRLFCSFEKLILEIFNEERNWFILNQYFLLCSG